MKKIIAMLSLLTVVSCGPSVERIDVIDGRDGRDGTSSVCSVSQVEGGITLSCSDGSSGFLANGTNGQDGADGQNGEDGSDGENGQDGQDGTDGINGSGNLSQIALNGCTLASSGVYAKLQGSGSLKLYSNSNCSGNSLASLSSTDEIYVLSGGNLLIFQSAANILYKLTFN